MEVSMMAGSGAQYNGAEMSEAASYAKAENLYEQLITNIKKKFPDLCEKNIKAIVDIHKNLECFSESDNGQKIKILGFMLDQYSVANLRRYIFHIMPAVFSNDRQANLSWAVIFELILNQSICVDKSVLTKAALDHFEEDERDRFSDSLDTIDINLNPENEELVSSARQAALKTAVIYDDNTIVDTLLCLGVSPIKVVEAQRFVANLDQEDRQLTSEALEIREVVFSIYNRHKDESSNWEISSEFNALAIHQHHALINYLETLSNHDYIENISGIRFLQTHATEASQSAVLGLLLGMWGGGVKFVLDAVEMMSPGQEAREKAWETIWRYSPWKNPAKPGVPQRTEEIEPKKLDF